MSDSFIAEYIGQIFDGVHPSWKRIFLSPKFKGIIQECFDNIDKDLASKGVKKSHIQKNGIDAYLRPEPKYIFEAFRYFDANNLRVIVVGQDPYPKIENAMGMSFSVQQGRDVPDSLRIIYECLQKQNLLDHKPSNGNLESIAAQGVLFLNRYLTRTPNICKSGSGSIYVNGDGGGKSTAIHKFWGKFTDALLEYMTGEFLQIKANYEKQQICVLLWGNPAMKVEKNLSDNKRVHVYTWRHPSPLSNNSLGSSHSEHFHQCNHFMKVNKVFESNPIDWDPDSKRTRRTLDQFLNLRGRTMSSVTSVLTDSDKEIIMKLLKAGNAYNDGTNTAANEYIKSLMDKRKSANTPAKKDVIEPIEEKIGEEGEEGEEEVGEEDVGEEEVGEEEFEEDVAEEVREDVGEEEFEEDVAEEVKEDVGVEEFEEDVAEGVKENVAEDKENTNDEEAMAEHASKEDVYKEDVHNGDDYVEYIENVEDVDVGNNFAIVMFTDGACPSNGRKDRVVQGGYAAWFPDIYRNDPNGIGRTRAVFGKLPDSTLQMQKDRTILESKTAIKCTNQRAELLGAVQGIEEILRNYRDSREKKPVIIIPDNIYVIRWMVEGIWKYRKVDKNLRTVNANRDLVVLLYQSLSALSKILPTIYNEEIEKRLFSDEALSAWKEYFKTKGESGCPEYDPNWEGLTVLHQPSHLTGSAIPKKGTIEWENWYGNDRADHFANKAIKNDHYRVVIE